jgi:predicted amidohydrolase YtcJ
VKQTFLAVTALIASAFLAVAQPPADLIVRNGKIVTMEQAQPVVQAVAIGNGVILALGTNNQIARFAGPDTKIVDLKGAFATPGLIESHGHFMGIGQFKRSLNLRDAKTWDDIVAMVAAAAKEAKPGEWIIGRGFHQSKWTEPPTPNVQGFPVHDKLSKASPNNPVLLTHASGHAAMVNQKAMDLAGIGKSTQDPKGGEILRDGNGNPTGLLNETAQGLTRTAYAAYLAKRSPEQRKEDSRLEATLAAQDCVRKGLTSFQDAGSPFDTVDLLREMEKEGKLGLRLWVMLRESNDLLKANGARHRVIAESQEHFTVRAIKRQIDGALGSRGAWLLAPYEDMPSSSGLNTEPLADIEQTAQYAIANGFQLCVHAIGDRGNRETLDIFERTFKANPDRKNLRWRIEHAQHLNAADIPRFGKLGVIAAMQAVHCTSDAPYVLARLGPKRAEEGAYVWRSLLDSGAVVTNGTDAPVEDVDPIPSLYAAVTRKLADGSEFFPKQRMTRMEALKSYTLSAAYAGFEEDRKGSLKVGKLGDLTVFSKDFLTAPDAEIPKMEVLYTIIGGKVVHQAR